MDLSYKVHYCVYKSPPWTLSRDSWI